MRSRYHRKLKCSRCHKTLDPGDSYSMSPPDWRIICFDCDGRMH